MGLLTSVRDKKFNEWLEGMSDESKAEVLKTKVAEEELTIREKSKHSTDKEFQGNKTLRTLILGIVMFVTSIALGANGCEYARRWKEVKEIQYQSEHPGHLWNVPNVTVHNALNAKSAPKLLNAFRFPRKDNQNKKETVRHGTSLRAGSV